VSIRKSDLDRLRAAGVPDAQGDLRRLFNWAFEGVPEEARSGAQASWDVFEDAVAKRERRVPVSQIIGRRAFWRHEFTVTPDVLDPRPETETLVEAALAEPFTRVLDLGTGSGCILISLLAERPDATGVGTDTSDKALLVAGENAARIGVVDRLVLPLSDWFDDIGGRFDLIVSNPPYIAASEMTDLAPEVRDHEPRAALTDEGDGLQAYRSIAAKVADHLTPGGRLLVEIGPTQAKAVTAIFRQSGLLDVGVQSDLDGRDRVISARNQG
jgi:release factor glutamine methyltransferase